MQQWTSMNTPITSTLVQRLHCGDKFTMRFLMYSHTGVVKASGRTFIHSQAMLLLTINNLRTIFIQNAKIDNNFKWENFGQR